MVSATAKKHVEQCGLQPALVGTCVGNGAGHVVYTYGQKFVVKIPRFRWAKHNLSIITAEDAQKNLQHAKAYFADYIPPTTVYRSTKNQTYCIVQELLPTYENLTVQHIKQSAELARQFADILQKNQLLLTEQGLSVDFFGKEGSIKTLLAFCKLYTPQMANILVVPGIVPQLYIADSQLFEVRKPENAQLSRRMMAEASRWGFELNRLFAKSGFGQDLKK